MNGARIVPDRLSSIHIGLGMGGRSVGPCPRQFPCDGWSGAAGRPTLKVMTVWSMLEECISQLDEPFRRSEIIGWSRRHHPGVNEPTLAAHIQAATANAANWAQNNPLGTRRPLLRRVDHGLYVRAGQPREPAIDEDEQAQLSAGRPEPGRRSGTDVIFIGCVRTKKAVASPASELFPARCLRGAVGMLRLLTEGNGPGSPGPGSAI
jgi:hypothetical protein